MAPIGEVIPLLWGEGWYPLERDVIDDCVEPLPGCYMLARLHGSIVVETRTGQAGDLNSRLKSHARDRIYDVFRVEYLDEVDDEDLDEALLSQEQEIYHGTHGVLGLGHGEKERPKRYRR